MYYTGIDLHKKTSFLTTIDKDGTIIYRANLKNIEELILGYWPDCITVSYPILIAITSYNHNCL